MKNLVIFGTGPFGEVARRYFESDSDYSVAAFTVDAAYMPGEIFQGLPVVPFDQVIAEFPPAQFEMYVAMGIQKVNQQRAAKVAEAEGKGYKLASFLSSKALAPAELVMRPNSFVMEGAVVMPFVEIGRDTVIWPHSLIGFHTRVGEHCWIAAATVGEAVTVGDYSFIGMNSTVAPELTIGKSNVIGAGALILKDTKDSEIYRGFASTASKAPSHRLRRI